MDKIDIDTLLKKLYYNVKSSTAAFQSVRKLYLAAKLENPLIRYKDVVKWLQKQETYGVFFPYKKKIQRSRTIVKGIDYLWQMDLMDLVTLESYNDGHKFVLLVIDIFSRFVWCFALLHKTGVEVTDKIKLILSTGRKPIYVQTDKGKEFKNRVFQGFLKENNITFMETQSEVKAAYAERAIKTIKGRIFKYMYYKETYKYYDIVNFITYNYNHTKHRVLGMKPIEVTKANEQQVWNEMYASLKNPVVRKSQKPSKDLNVGDYVRISFLRNLFSREYSDRWSQEIFQIFNKAMRDGVTVYWLRDFSGEEVLGSFYREELQLTDVSKDTVYKIEKIIKTRKTKAGVKQYLVKWKYWNSKYNSWVNHEDLETL